MFSYLSYAQDNSKLYQSICVEQSPQKLVEPSIQHAMLDDCKNAIESNLISQYSPEKLNNKNFYNHKLNDEICSKPNYYVYQLNFSYVDNTNQKTQTISNVVATSEPINDKNFQKLKNEFLQSLNTKYGKNYSNFKTSYKPMQVDNFYYAKIYQIYTSCRIDTTKLILNTY